MKRNHPKKERAAMASISSQLAALEKMTVGELAERYREVVGIPTRSRNRAYLIKKIGWEIQAAQDGGLSPRALARIEELAPQAPVRWRAEQAKAAADIVATRSSRSSRDPRLPDPGSVISRVHKGVEHRVVVLDDGFEYAGRIYPSLSQLAREIAKTPWNGFAFFHLGHGAISTPSEEARG